MNDRQTDEHDSPGLRVSAVSSVAGFLVTLYWWQRLLAFRLEQEYSLALIVGGFAAGIPVVRLGRMLLDRHPVPPHPAWITSAVHMALMFLFGSAIIEAVKVLPVLDGGSLGIPRIVGGILVAVTGFGVLLTILNLAVRGLGAPFAIALSSRLAQDWMYRWTRNPMVLFTFAFFFSAGVYLQSWYFVGWVMVVVCPAWIYFVKVFEERELEMRFGESYNEYRRTTPFLWPRKPIA